MIRPVFTCLLLCAFCISNQLLAQSFPCGTDFLHQQRLLEPDIYREHTRLKEAASQFFKNNPPNAGKGPTGLSASRVVPVVFHLVHQDGPENLSNAEVQQALAWLNQAFANGGAFDRGSGYDTGIQFCLAQRGPNGQATNGITRTLSPLTSMYAETDDSKLKNLVRWKPSEYVNIWVVREACSTTFGCNLTAYAYYPAYHGNSSDGIVIEAKWLTDVATVAPLIHEMGHYLGLSHTFQGGCSNNDCLNDGDYVCDTPPDQSTAGIPCDQSANTCQTDSKSGLPADVPDMTQNFMDYSPYACMHDFTPGQSARMLFFLDGARKSLLNARSCLPPCPSPVSARLAFIDTTIAAGAGLLFTNLSGSAGQYNWILDGQLIGTQSTATYTFDKPGVYKISLKVAPVLPDLCEGAQAQATVRVICNVAANFTVDKKIVKLGTPVNVTANLDPGVQHTWYINGVAGNTLPGTVYFPSPGQQEIKLVVSKGFCRDSYLIQITVRDTSTANCTDVSFQQLAEVNPDAAWVSYGFVSELADGDLLTAATLPAVVNGPVTPARITLIRQKPNGASVWNKTSRDLTVSCIVEDVVATPDSGFYLLVLCDATVEPYNLQLIKCSRTGSQVWQRGIPTDGAPNFTLLLGNFKKMLLMPDGGVLIGGQFGIEMGIARYDAAGKLLWARRYGVGANEQVRSIAPAPDGGCYALRSGQTRSFVTRFDVNGGLIWDKALDASRAVQGRQIIPAPNDRYYIAGNNITGIGQAAWLAQMDANGAIIWSNIYRSANNANFAPAVFNDLYWKDNVLTAVGQTSSQTGAFARLTQDGQPLALKSYDQLSGNLTHIIPARGGGYWLSGGVLTLPFIYPRFWLLKSDPSGSAGECPATPRTISTSDYLLTPVTQPAGLPELSPLADLPVAPKLLLSDTLALPFSCEVACANFEICDNNTDDDGDGLIDCLDPDCNCPANRCYTERNDIWYFGSNGDGLDFSTNPPTYLNNGSQKTIYQSSTACDERGQLLFYTDGVKVYDRFHAVMPNGVLTTNVPANIPGAETLAVPHPGVKGQYYVFSAGPYIGEGLRVSLVDMRLNNGRGDVVTGQKFLSFAPTNAINRGIAAVRSCSFDGYWVVIKQFLSNRFYAYPIRTNGLATTPVISPVGFFPDAVDVYVQMKISPDGKYLATVFSRDSLGIELFDFDSYQTGILSNPRRLFFQEGFVFGGLEFSPNGRFLYVSAKRNNQSFILQFDLTAADVPGSRQIIGSEESTTLFQMQLTPQREIYVAGSRQIDNGPFVSISGRGAIIHQPDRAGPACEFEPGALTFLNGAWCNAVASDFATPFIKLDAFSPDTVCDLNQPIYYRIPKLNCDVDSVQWILEGLDADLLNQYQQAFITYRSYGSGRLIVRANTPCGNVADTLPIFVVPPSNRTLDLGPDRTVCDNGVFTFNAGAGFARYRWNDGLADSILTTLLPGKYWVDVWDACGRKQSDTVQVRVAPATRLDLGPDASPCKNETLSFQRPAYFERWQWSPPLYASCDTCRNVTVRPAKPVAYTVVATTGDGCISVDTLLLEVRDKLPFQIDTGICRGRRIVLYGQSLPADTSISILRPAPGGIGCDTLISVRVRPLETPQQRITVSICPNAVYRYRGVDLPPDTTAYFFLPTGNLNCDTFVTVMTESWPSLNLNALPKDTTILIGAGVSLNAQAQGEGPFQYNWTPAESLSCETCTDPTATPLSSTLYRVVATDNNRCTAEATVNVEVKDLCVDMIPNAFTPNGDDVNERFYPLTQPCVRRVLRWTVLNRWGQKMFERLNFAPNQPDLGWDGTAQGQAQPMDGYVWFAEFELYNGEKVFKKGGVTLLR